MAEVFLLKFSLNVGAATAIGGFADSVCQWIEIHVGGRGAVDRRAAAAAEAQLDAAAAAEAEDGTEEGEVEEVEILVEMRKGPEEEWTDATVVVLPPRDGKPGEKVLRLDSAPGEDVPFDDAVDVRQRFECKRMCRFAASFGGFGGTNSFFWYQYILPHFAAGNFYRMLCMDMVIYNAYFVFIGLAGNECMRPRAKGPDGKRVDRDGLTCCEAVVTRYPSTYLIAQSVLFPADLIMFGYIPRDFRVVFIKTVDILWMAGASYTANRPIQSRPADSEGLGAELEKGAEAAEPVA